MIKDGQPIRMHDLMQIREMIKDGQAMSFMEEHFQKTPAEFRAAIEQGELFWSFSLIRDVVNLVLASIDEREPLEQLHFDDDDVPSHDLAVHLISTISLWLQDGTKVEGMEGLPRNLRLAIQWLIGRTQLLSRHIPELADPEMIVLQSYVRSVYRNYLLNLAYQLFTPS